MDGIPEGVLFVLFGSDGVTGGVLRDSGGGEGGQLTQTGIGWSAGVRSLGQTRRVPNQPVPTEGHFGLPPLEIICFQQFIPAIRPKILN